MREPDDAVSGGPAGPGPGDAEGPRVAGDADDAGGRGEPRDADEASLDERILAEIQSLAPPGAEWDVPPPIFREMETTFLEYRKGRSLTLSVALAPHHAGPTGMLQGGVVAVALDNAYGPLAFLTARSYAVTVTLDLSFVRPLPVAAGSLEVEARVVEATRRLVFMEGEARGPDGKRVAVSHTEMMIVDDPPVG